MRRCVTCGQELRAWRLGVVLPPLKARILDAIARGDGITTAELIGDLGLPIKASTLRVHVAQINEILAPTGYRIKGGRWLGYRVVQSDSPGACKTHQRPSYGQGGVS